MTLDQLLALILESWPTRFERGRLTHIHRNHLQLDDGSYIHLRVLIQETEPPRQDGSNVDLSDA